MSSKKSLLLLYFLLYFISVVSQDSTETPKLILENHVKKSNQAYEAYNYEEVLKHGAALIDKGKKYRNDYYTFLGYDILGGIYSEIDDSIQGKIYSEKALQIARKTQADSLIAWGTLNLGILYSENPKTYQKAIRYFEESVALNIKNNELRQVYLTYINLAWTYMDSKELGKAFSVLNKAKTIPEKIQVGVLNEQYIEMLFGRYYLQKEQYIAAKKKLVSVSKIADRDSITDLALETYYYLSRVYSETNDYQNAFEALTAYNEYRKKAFTEEKIEATEKAKAKFDLEQTKKNLNVALREKQYSQELVSKSKALTTILIAATIILLLALLGFYLFFNTRNKYIRKLKSKNKELILAKDKAEKLSKVKTRFLSTVSHELRTPLYGVIGISTLLIEDDTLKAYQEDLKSLKFSADYLLALVNDVLLLSKMDAEAISLSEQPFKLDVLLQNIVRSFEFILKSNNNKLHLRIDEKIPNAQIGDSVKLSQIVINLIGNAIKFNQDGNIWFALDLVKITNKGLYQTRFSIKDDGPGIPLDKQKVIFEEFSQIENTNHNYKGTGLGLTIVKKLLKLYKSKIHLKSSPDEGSEFSFILNLKKTPDGFVEKSRHDTTIIELAESFDNLNLNILIVDDNRINQIVTQKILEKYNVKSSLASDGPQAFAMNRAQKFDMILMDINMPKVNGMEATKMIRKYNKNIPIIALTAVELDEMRHEILNSGISDIIHKPYDIREFLNSILRNLSSTTIKVSGSR